MNAPMLKLASPPIVEAVVDIECDMPPVTYRTDGFNLKF